MTKRDIVQQIAKDLKVDQMWTKRIVQRFLDCDARHNALVLFVQGGQ